MSFFLILEKRVYVVVDGRGWFFGVGEEGAVLINSCVVVTCSFIRKVAGVLRRNNDSFSF